LIRQANKYDIDKIVELLKDFAIQSNNQLKGSPLDWSKTYVTQIITNIMAGQGFILIDDKQTGILVAYKSHCFWNDKSIQLQEVMLHGYNKFVIARLIKEYTKIAKELLRKREINQATISSYNNLKFERYGMKLIEYHWEVN
jgi:N-acetylglutamate synthase-like GNAT family acetyltransferase